MPVVPRLLALLTTLVLPASAGALPLVAVDADPLTAGVQPSASVSQGASFDVDLFVDLGAEPLNGFQFTLEFDPTVLAALDVVDGGFLLDPVFEVEKQVGALSVSFAEATLLPAGATGSGVLATLSFEALAAGSSALDLVVSNDPTETLILSAPFGAPICGVPGGRACDVSDGSITVVGDGSTPIPEPRAALLFLLGFAIAALRLRPVGASARRPASP